MERDPIGQDRGRGRTGAVPGPGVKPRPGEGGKGRGRRGERGRRGRRRSGSRLGGLRWAVWTRAPSGAGTGKTELGGAGCPSSLGCVRKSEGVSWGHRNCQLWGDRFPTHLDVPSAPGRGFALRGENSKGVFKTHTHTPPNLPLPKMKGLQSR